MTMSVRVRILILFLMMHLRPLLDCCRGNIAPVGSVRQHFQRGRFIQVLRELRGFRMVVNSDGSA